MSAQLIGISMAVPWRGSVARASLAAIALQLVSVVLLAAAPRPEIERVSFQRKHQTGVRIGAWANTGDLPAARDDVGTFEADFSDASIYFEVFVGVRLLPQLMAELSMGTTNRGEVSFIEAGGTNVGNVLIHPVLVSLRVYPLASMGLAWHPYLSVGGGVYFGRRTVQFTTSSEVAAFGLNEETGTDFNIALGGGVDWPVGETVGLEAAARYLPIEFDNGLQTIRTYDALAFTIGVKYLFHSK